MSPSIPPSLEPRPQRGQVVRVPIPKDKKRPAVVIRVDESVKRALVVYFTSTESSSRGECIRLTSDMRDFKMLGLEIDSFAYGGQGNILPSIRSVAFKHLNIEQRRCPAGLLLQLTQFVERHLPKMTEEQQRADLPDGPR